MDITTKIRKKIISPAMKKKKRPNLVVKYKKPVKEKKRRNCQTRSGKKKKKYKSGERRHPMQKMGRLFSLKKEKKAD